MRLPPVFRALRCRSVFPYPALWSALQVGTLGLRNSDSLDLVRKESDKVFRDHTFDTIISNLLDLLFQYSLLDRMTSSISILLVMFYQLFLGLSHMKIFS